MKHLVQRKFAQGVPIPASNSVPPTPPERKPDPSYPPRNVYHNNMSARSLLDIVALQTIHKHKQPMVLLERLREDEIPSAPAPPKLLVPLRKRRNGMKLNENNMCLRSGKRKSPDAGKAPVKKRKKASSESTDDIPLVYFSKPSPAKPPIRAKAKDGPAMAERGKRTATVARRGADRSTTARQSSTDRFDDGSDFTFKEPSSPLRSSRIFKRKPVTNTAIAAGRPSRKAAPAQPDARRSGLRSAAVGARSTFRLREKRLSVKKLPKPVTRKPMPRPMVKDETSRLPSPSPSPQPGTSGLNGVPLSISEASAPPSENGTVMCPEQPPPPLPSPLPGTSGMCWFPETRVSFSESSERGTLRGSSDLPTLYFSSRETTPAISTPDLDAKSDIFLPYTINANIFSSPTSMEGMVDWCISPNDQSEPTTNSQENSQDPETILEYNRPKLVSAEMTLLNGGPVSETSAIALLSEMHSPESADTVNNEGTRSESADRVLLNNNEKAAPETMAAENRETREDNQGQNNRDEGNQERRQISLTQKRSNEKNDLNKKQKQKKRKQDEDETLLEMKKEKAKKLAEKRAQKKNAPKENKAKQSAAKSGRARTRKAEPKPASKPGPVEKSTRLLRNSRDTTQPPAPANPDVYEFIAELEASRPPSSLRPRRQTNKTKEPTPSTSKPQTTPQETPEPTPLDTPEPVPPQTPEPIPPEVPELDQHATQEPSAAEQDPENPLPQDPENPPEENPIPLINGQLDEDKEIFLDVFPGSVYCIHITPKKPSEDGQNCLSVSIVKKEECYSKNKSLIASSPSLLDKFLHCLSAELLTVLDNLLANERQSRTTEPRESTSHTMANANGQDDAAVPSKSGEAAAPTSGEPIPSTSREPITNTIKVEGDGTSTSDSSNYLDQRSGTVLAAPTFYPTAEEFADPIKYYDKIAPQASAYGLCKIVPPESFSPPCNMSEAIRFMVIYQYISKLYNRWGPNSREMATIKAYLRTQSVVFARSPLLDGSEVNLSKLYYAVERNGGLSTVIQRKRWGRVAEEMKLTKLQHPEKKLDSIYMRYLLPYATLSDQERQKIMAEVETCWTTKYQKMLERARNPFQRQNRMLRTECESESDDDNEDSNVAGALKEAEDCIVQGRTMNLATFKKVATSLMDAHFDPNKQPPSAVEVEKAYWRAVLLGTEHIVANTASIDTGEEGYGFPKDPNEEYGSHSWNLKVWARNPNNVLRYLGAALGVTVPTLHLSMLFSTSCWHRDPHGLPWTEYIHSGAEKIWYGIPRGESSNFRRAVETLCPAYCQNKSIWLASEITMIPPNILSEHGVKLSRLIQKPGEYVVVFPEAYSCSITTGFAISESVYFASNTWLSSVYKLFQELRNSCEPTMFSLEQLLLNGCQEPGAPHHVSSVLAALLGAELEHRRALEAKGLRVQERPPVDVPLNTSYFRAWNARDQDECEYCRSTLYLSKVIGLTGRKSAVCPEHAIRLLEAKKYKNVDLNTLEFVSSHSTAALEELLERLESRTGSDSNSDSQPEREVIDLTGPEPAQ